MKKTLLYIILLALLCVGVYYTVFYKGDTFDKKEAGFSVSDTANIGRIFLVRSNGQQVNLQRTDSGWVVDNHYKAYRGSIANLLRTLKLQEAQYPVPKVSHNGVIKSLAGNHVKVEIYDLKGEKIRTFYVGAEGYQSTGSYMLMEHAKRPYLVKIPNFGGYLLPYYTTDIADWRDRTVFNFKPDEIKSISIRYLDDTTNSFVLTQDGTVKVDAPNIHPSWTLNDKRVKLYLGYFAGVSCEGYINGVYKLDTLIAMIPKFCVMDVVAKDGRHQHVEVYHMPLNKRSKNLSGRKALFDIDRKYAVMNNFKDTVIIQSVSFGKIFHRGRDFYNYATEVK